MKKTKEQKRIEKYSKKPIDQFSPILPWIYLPFRPKTFKKAWRLINSVLSQFFFLQTFQALHLTHRPVIYVDTELDEKIPFVPEHVKTYMSFIPFFIKPISMLIKRCGYRNAAPYINVFLKFLATQYHNASSIYKFCMTTTHRPDYKKSKEFRTIHAADPHLLCVPSLHVTIAAGTYAWFKQFFQTDLLPKEEAEMRLEEIHQQAIKITESVLFVKQHSVNCIPLALYMLTSTMNKSFFSIQDADDFMSELFRNSPEIPESDRTEIRNYFKFMYEKSLLENIYSENWQDCVKHWLIDFANSTGQKAPVL